MADGEHGCDHNHDRREQHRRKRGERRRRHDDRNQQQDGEGVVEAARQEEEGAQLERVVGQHHEGGLGAQPVARGKRQAEGDVEGSRQGDEADAPGERQREAKPEMDDGDGGGLAGDGQPAQADQRLEPEAPPGEVVFGERLAVAQAGRRDLGHGGRTFIGRAHRPGGRGGAERSRTGLTGRSNLSLRRRLGPTYSFCNAKRPRRRSAAPPRAWVFVLSAL